MKRALSLVLSLILVLALLPASTALADSQAYGQEVWLRSAAIGDGVVYSEGRREHLLERRLRQAPP